MKKGLFVIVCVSMIVAFAFASAASPLNGDTDTLDTSAKPDFYLNPAEEHVNISLDEVKSVTLLLVMGHLIKDTLRSSGIKIQK